MRKTKIYRIISTFSEKEKKDFERFARSPYYSKSREYSPILKELYSISKKDNLNKETAYKDFFTKVYPEKRYSNKTLRNRLNELTTLSKKFIMEKTLASDAELSKNILLKGLRNKKLTDIFVSEYTKNSEEHNKFDYKSLIKSETSLIYIYVLLENQNFGKALTEYSKYTDYMITMMMEKYFAIMLEYESQKQYGMKIQNNISDDLMQNFKPEGFINMLERRNNGSYLSILLYYYMYRSFKDMEDVNVYNKFTELFFRNIEVLSYEQKKDFFGYMISRFFNLINSGKQEHLKDVFKLYNIKLKLGIFSELKEIRYPSAAFRDYVVVGLRLKKYIWVENFISKYSCELPEEIRWLEESMAYARLSMFRKEYDKVIEIINKLKSANSLYILDASRMKLRAYYEMSQFEEAYMEIDRVRHYIKNNTSKIPMAVRKYSNFFLDVYGKLLKLKLSPDKREIEYFYKTVKENPSLVAKEWVIDKIKEMKQDK